MKRAALKDYTAKYNQVLFNSLFNNIIKTGRYLTGGRKSLESFCSHKVY